MAASRVVALLVVLAVALAAATAPASATEVAIIPGLSSLSGAAGAAGAAGQAQGGAAPSPNGGGGGGTEGGGGSTGGEFDECKTCVFVLERIKKGTNLLLPSICSEIYAKFPNAYSFCHQTLNALSLNGNNVRYWLFEGCYKYEVYQSKEWVRPCPSHVMCSVLKKLDNQPFCRPLPIEDPFANSGSQGGQTSSAAAGNGGAVFF